MSTSLPCDHEYPEEKLCDPNRIKEINKEEIVGDEI